VLEWLTDFSFWGNIGREKLCCRDVQTGGISVFDLPVFFLTETDPRDFTGVGNGRSLPEATVLRR
jgi:hypothetical protein